MLPLTPGIADAEAVGRRLLEALSAPVAIEGRDLTVPASIGVALAPIGARIAVDELLRQADVAMYQAKAAGKQRLATYDPASDPGPAAAPVPVAHTRRARAGAPEASPAV